MKDKFLVLWAMVSMLGSVFWQVISSLWASDPPPQREDREMICPWCLIPNLRPTDFYEFCRCKGCPASYSMLMLDDDEVGDCLADFAEQQGVALDEIEYRLQENPDAPSTDGPGEKLAAPIVWLRRINEPTFPWQGKNGKDPRVAL